MTKRIQIVGLMLCGLVAGIAAAKEDLAKNFATPPDSARPWVYWFQLNGNLTKESITAGKAGIGGRFLYGQFLGSNFAVHQDGTWTLAAPQLLVETVNGKQSQQELVKPLETGKIAGFTPGKWHRLALTLKGDEMRASVDGKEVARMQNEGYPGRKNGMAYLMSSYDTNCFDNVVIAQ
jgi:hypothetical protein